jgi:maltose/maltodextrin transport system permease protein
MSKGSAQAWRYLFPGVAGMLLFVAFPLLFTMQIGFTNFSSNNLLSQERAREYLLEQTAPDQAGTLGFTLHPDGDEYGWCCSRCTNRKSSMILRAAPRSKRARSCRRRWPCVPRSRLSTRRCCRRSRQLPAQCTARPEGTARAPRRADAPGAEAARWRVLHYAGVREFGPVNPLWRANPDGSLTQLESGERYRPDMATGFFTGEKSGAQLQPGFKVNIGLGNYRRLFTDPDFRGPFLSIFGWTMVFASLTVLFFAQPSA